MLIGVTSTSSSSSIHSNARSSVFLRGGTSFIASSLPLARTLVRFLPFMGDYTKVWTNDNYFNYFKLSECEKEIILKEMKEYTKKFKEKYID